MIDAHPLVVVTAAATLAVGIIVLAHAVLLLVTGEASGVAMTYDEFRRWQ